MMTKCDMYVHGEGYKKRGRTKKTRIHCVKDKEVNERYDKKVSQKKFERKKMCCHVIPKQIGMRAGGQFEVGEHGRPM